MEKCSKCGREAIIYLSYGGLHLCKNHFCAMFEKRFFQTVGETSKITKGERIAVGVSGGKDSSVMLYLLHKLQKKLPFELVAITIDEGIKGYRASSLKIAEKLCKKLKIEHRVVSFKEVTGKTLDEIMKEKKTIPCSYCGVSRRYLLNKAAREMRADKLAIGHNLDDAAQTTLMNIMRNEPTRLARYLHPIEEDKKFIPRIKPLIRTPEKEVAIYGLLKGLEIHGQECPYAVHAFRQEIRHKLNEIEEKYPGTKFKILNSFMTLQNKLRQNVQKGDIKGCETCGEPTSHKMCKFCEMIGKKRD